MSDFKPTHRHFKGGLYELICYATQEATMESVVVYRGPDMRVWVRPLTSFEQEIGTGRRFEQLS